MSARWRVIDEAGAVHEIEAAEDHGCRRKIYDCGSLGCKGGVVIVQVVPRG